MNGGSHVVCTTAHLACEAHRAGQSKVCFDEHIATRPSLLLRTVLPVPLRTTGTYREVGSVSRCLYSDGGYLTKQIRQIVAGERIDFDIIEQTIRYAGKIALKGGTIRVEPRDDGTCRVEMSTRYELRYYCCPSYVSLIDRVVAAMHKIVIRDMRERLELQRGQSPRGLVRLDRSRRPFRILSD